MMSSNLKLAAIFLVALFSQSFARSTTTTGVFSNRGRVGALSAFRNRASTDSDYSSNVFSAESSSTIGNPGAASPHSLTGITFARGGALGSRSRENKIINGALLVGAIVVVPTVAVPAVRIAATAVIAVGLFNVIQGNGFVIR